MFPWRPDPHPFHVRPPHPIKKAPKAGTFRALVTNQNSKTRYPEGGPCGSNSVQVFSAPPTTYAGAMRHSTVAALRAAVGRVDCVFNMSAIK